MKIYCIRHSEWHERLGTLSPEGERQTRYAAKILTVKGLTRDNSRLFTSPVRRAAITASVIAKEAGLRAPQVVEWLSEKAGFYDFFITGVLAINNSGDHRHVVAVGHGPVFEEFLQGLLKWQGLLKEGEKLTMANGEVYEVDLNTQNVEKLG